MRSKKSKKSKVNKKEIIICRCEDVTLDEVEAIIDKGIVDPEQIKRFLHVGMGPCQGRTCGQLVARIVAQKTGRPVSAIKKTSQRPPLVSVPIARVLGEEDE
jgi:bacterioferritin-associated ferredoxin